MMAASRGTVTDRSDDRQKGRRYVEVADKGYVLPGRAETLGAVASRWPVAICSGALEPRSNTLRRLDRSTGSRRSFGNDTDNASRPKAITSPWPLSRPTPAIADARRPETARQPCTADLARPLYRDRDSLAGIIAAKGAGMQAIGVTNTYRRNSFARLEAMSSSPELAAPDSEWILSLHIMTRPFADPSYKSQFGPLINHLTVPCSKASRIDLPSAPHVHGRPTVAIHW